MGKLYEHKLHPHKPRNTNLKHREELKAGGFNLRLAVAFTKGFGSMQAFYVLVAWMFVWMGLSTAGVWLFELDRYPFPFLLFCSNLVQLWALPVIMVGQNVLNRKAELQAEEMFHDVEATQHNIEEIMKHQDIQDLKILEILSRIEDLAKQRK